MKIKEIITERIGSHAYKEVTLLLDGTKPAAIIHSDIDMRHLMPYVRSGQLVRIKGAFSGWIVAQKDEAWRLKEIYNLVNMIKEMRIDNKEVPISMSEYHTKLGKLLGYDDADIDYFVKREQARGSLVMRLEEFTFSKEDENTGNWYVRVDGKHLGKPSQPEPFPNKTAALNFALALSSKKGIGLKRMTLTKSWMDAPVTESNETDDAGYRIPRAHRTEVGCSECGKMNNLEQCGSYSHVADPMCPTCRKRWNYQWCPACELNHIKGYCPQVGAMADKVGGN